MERPHGVGAADYALETRQFIHVHLGDRFEERIIFIASGEVTQQILHCFDVQVFQSGESGFFDGGEGGEWRVEGNHRFSLSYTGSIAKSSSIRKFFIGAVQ